MPYGKEGTDLRLVQQLDGYADSARHDERMERPALGKVLISLLRRS